MYRQSRNTTMIRYLYHISDIHIRLFSRRNEYHHVFDQLYSFLRERVACHGKDKAMIVITGDVLHNKIDLQPECTMMTYEFLKELSLLFPTILIAGNHDALLNNRDRIDSLTSILHERTPPHLFYYTRTGVYRHENILFVVNSLLDDAPWLTCDMVKKEDESDITVALYHGQIHGWKNQAGYQSDYGDKMVTDFDGFDLVLLGDIHKHQYMNKKQTIAYAGSLISQNYGETDLDHGVLVWDLDTMSSSLTRLENPYGYREFFLTLETDDVVTFIERTTGERWDKDTVSLPPWGHVKLHLCPNIVLASELQVKNMLKKQFAHTRFQFIHSESKKSDIVADENLRVEYSDEAQFRQYIDERWSKESSAFRQQLVDELLKDFYHMRSMSEHSRSLWTLEYIRFSHLFGYGADNMIDLRTFPTHTVTGIFGKNSVGKSTLIDVISFLLYGKITRSSHGNSVPREVIHFHEKEGWGEIGIRLGSDSYILKKHCQRTATDKIKIVETLYHIDEHGQKMQLTDEQRKKTDKLVHNMIGGCKSFLFTNLFLQQKEESFRDMKQASRKDFLYDLFGLDWFEKYRREKEDEVKSLRTEQKILGQRVAHSVRSEWLSKISQIQKTLDTLRHQYAENKKVLSELRHEKEKVILRLRHVDVDDMDNIHTQISETQKQKQKLESDISRLRQRRDESKRFLSHYSLAEIEFLQQSSHYNETLVQKHGPHAQNASEDVWRSTYEHILSTVRSSEHITQEWEHHKLGIETEIKRLLESKPSYDEDNLLSEPFQHESFVDERIKVCKEIESIETWLAHEYKDMSHLHPYLSEFEKKVQDTHLLRCRYEMERELFKKDQHVTYNKECASCMANPHYVQRKTHHEQCRRLKKEYQDMNALCETCWKTMCDLFSLDVPSTCVSWTDLVQHTKTLVYDSQRLYQERTKMLQTHQHRLKEIEQYLQAYENTKRARLAKKIDVRIAKLEKQLHSHPLRQHYDVLFVYLRDLETYRFIDTMWKMHRKHDTLSSNVSKLVQDYHEHDLFLKTSQDQIQTLETQLIQTHVSLERLQQDSSHYLHNQELLQEAKRCEEKIHTYEQQDSFFQEQCLTLEKDLVQINAQYDEWCRESETFDEVCRRLDYLEKLMTTIERDGLPLYLLKKKLPMIETDINTLLSGFLDKTLVLRVEEKDVVVGMEVDTRITNYLGGMESFIIDLSLKLGFSKFANLPRSNFFIIDEGISVMDQERIGNISYLFDFLSQITDHVFLISHLPTIKDFVHQSIEIMKDPHTQKSRLVVT